MNEYIESLFAEIADEWVKDGMITVSRAKELCKLVAEEAEKDLRPMSRKWFC